MVALPDKPNVPSTRIEDYSFLFAGEKKIGKTAFCSKWPDSFIAECEPGNAKHLNCRYVDILSWNDFLETIKLIENKPNYCKTFVTDDVPSLYSYCYKHVRKLLAMADTEKDNFDVWRTIRNLMTAALDRIKGLQSKGICTIYTTHIAINTVEDVNNRQISKLEPTMSKQCAELMFNITHFVGMMMRDAEGKRVMVLEGNSFMTCGHGFSKSFLSQGVPIKELPLGNSESEAYKNFVDAFNNRFVVPSTKNPIKIGVNVQRRVKPPIGK